MRGILGRLLAIGADAGDDEDTRLRKVLLLAAALTIAPLAVLWGLLYWIAGAPIAALIPWAYAVTSGLGLVVFGVTRRYSWFAASQFAPYTILPFLLMWSLGGVVEGSAVGLWAGLSPIVALLLGHRRLATLLAVAYAALIVVSVLAPAPAAATIAAPWRDLFFILNLAMMPLVGWRLVRVFAGGREGALHSMRSVVRRYLPPDLIKALHADPQRLDLGGQVAEVTVMFADLGGYSTYAETRAPADVVALLNRYFAAALPAILEEGGTPMQLPGDAIFAIFGAPTPRPDHAGRACRAAAVILERTAHLAEPPIDGPCFHIGINSGPALVGNIGSDEYRNFTAIGDTTNVAARLQGIADAGEIVIGPETARLLNGTVRLASLGPVSVKGRTQPVDAFRVASASG
ncbi:MAG TPA: adenylate/guanylate cyclase domain-containing protein [Burkholderiales bacterium]|nr:adenylate/guanylate cyclase domain-containing protein [Burkholderiales bacterium]